MLVILLVCEWSATVTLNIKRNKVALLWAEAQLCLPYVCLEKEIKEKKRKRVTYSDPIVNYSHPKVTFTILNMT